MGSYIYVEQPGDTLTMQSIVPCFGRGIKPIMWAQQGRYGWISKEQIRNLRSRQRDLDKQQKGYMRDKPVNLVFHWEDTTPLDPITVKLMREQI